MLGAEGKSSSTASVSTLAMFNPWLSLGLKAFQIGVEAQTVIALRMLRFAAGLSRENRNEPDGD
jgi:hypothetical protein